MKLDHKITLLILALLMLIQVQILFTGRSLRKGQQSIWSECLGEVSE